MNVASLAERLRLALRLGSPPDTRGTDAALRLIEGDVDGAVLAAEAARTARSALTRSEAYAVLAWAHLIRGERPEAEGAASVARRMRTTDPLLTATLVVASGGPSTGAASALTGIQGVTSLVGATRVFVDHGRLADVRAEIATLPSARERAALQGLQVGLVALDRRQDVDDIAARLVQLGQSPCRYVAYASVLGELGTTELALRYLRLAADGGCDDVAGVDADPRLEAARSRPAFEAIRQGLVENAATHGENASPTDPRVP